MDLRNSSSNNAKEEGDFIMGLTHWDPIVAKCESNLKIRKNSSEAIMAVGKGLHIRLWSTYFLKLGLLNRAKKILINMCFRGKCASHATNITHINARHYLGQVHRVQV